MAVEGLPHPSGHHLGRLKSRGRGLGSLLAARLALYLTGLLSTLLLLASVVLLFNSDQRETSTLYHELSAIQEPWSDSLAEQITSYRGWLSNHGTNTEQRLFDGFATLLLSNVVRQSVAPNESLLGSISFSAQTGILRVVFVFLASARFCLAVLLTALYLGVFKYRPYVGGDLLGQTGNGRLFYSGVKAGLDTISNSGAPDLLVRGLACPEQASRGETHGSPLWSPLGEWQATNTTNESLAAILVRNSETAAFVPRLEEESRFKGSFRGASLGEYVPWLLRGALHLHAAYAAGNLHPALPTSNQAGAAGAREYAQLVTNAFHQVLSLNQRRLLGELSSTEVATLVLALESGKVLAHSFEGGKWFRVSNSIHLSARAVLHSVLSYPTEYDFSARERLRRALVYASRHSPFAPVRMPIGLDPYTSALRQWAEVLLVLPHQLNDSVEEIELTGLIREAHRRWSDEILPKAHSLVSDLSATSSATQSDLIFVPVPALVKLLRLSVTDRELSRLADLSSKIGARQRRGGEPLPPSDEAVSMPLMFDRVFLPFLGSEIATLAKLHDLSESDLQEWSVLRNIIAPFGWLARRVGDYTVPESSVIFTVFRATAGSEAANSYGFIGRTGLVPLRGSKCREYCGAGWTASFPTFLKVTMAEKREDYEKLLKGIKEDVVDDPIAATTPA